MPFTGEDRRRYTNLYRARRRAEAKLFLGGVCVDCGTDQGLEFDHIDPSTKVTNVGKLWTASKAAFWREVSKCALRCGDCHNVRSVAEGHYSWGGDGIAQRTCL